MDYFEFPSLTLYDFYRKLPEIYDLVVKRNPEIIINRFSILFLAVVFINSTLTGCFYKQYHFKGKPRVVGAYLARYMDSHRYLVLYAGNGIYHLANHRLKQDTLYGNLETIDEQYLPYLISDTINPNFKALEKRYQPAEAVHVFTVQKVDSADHNVKIPVASISSIKVYHWKMTTKAKLLIILPVGIVFITLILIGVYAMDFSVVY